MKNKCKISIKMVVSQPGFGGQHGPDYPETKTLCQFPKRFLFLDRLNGKLGLECGTMLFPCLFHLE